MEPLTNDEREFMDWLTSASRERLPRPRPWLGLTDRMREADSDEVVAASITRLTEIGYLYHLEEEKRRAR